MAKEDFIFFWGGTYSQWCPSPFIIDGVEYNCCEQYMMAKKALMFNDFKSLELIMASEEPDDQKALGRMVKGFNVETWVKYCRKIVYDANFAKFSQNPLMKKELMATGDKEIVEASPEDRIWGIGLRATDKRAWDKSTWEGTNWLGEAIMEVRATLKKELMDQIVNEVVAGVKDSAEVIEITKPTTLEECFVELAKLDGLEEFKTVPEDETSTYHHGLGRWLRNNWDLWGNENKLCKFFNTIGINHADDMSSIILVSFHRYINHVFIDLKGQVLTYWKHWYNENVPQHLPPNITNISEEFLNHYELYKDTLK